MASPSSWMRRVERLEREVAAQKKPSLRNSSLDGGFLAVNDPTGQTTRLSIGQQFDGTYTVSTLTTGGVPQPTPTAPILRAAPGGVVGRWNGDFEGSALVPMNFRRIEVHASTDPLFMPDLVGALSDTLITTLESSRSVNFYVAADGTRDEIYVILVARDEAGSFGAISDLASAIPGPWVVAADVTTDATTSGAITVLVDMPTTVSALHVTSRDATWEVVVTATTSSSFTVTVQNRTTGAAPADGTTIVFDWSVVA